METMCCVLLGKAEAKGNGCGQTIVLEREERNARRGQRGIKNGKAECFLNLNDLPIHMHTYVCTHALRHARAQICSRTVPAEVLFVIIRWWECATAR